MTPESNFFLKKFSIVGSLLILSVLVISLSSFARSHLQLLVHQDKALAYPFGWLPEIEIRGPQLTSNASIISYNSVVDQRNNNSYVFLKVNDSQSSNNGLYYQKLDSGGNPVGNLVLVSNAGSFWYEGMVAIGPSGYLDFVWRVQTPTGQEIRYTRINPENNTILIPESPVVPTPSGVLYLRPLVAVASNNNVYIAWETLILSGGQGPINLRISDSSGAQVGNILSFGGVAYRLSITISPNNHIHLTWKEGGPYDGVSYYVQLNPDGTRVGGTPNPIPITGSFSSFSYDSVITTDPGNRAYVLWKNNSGSYLQRTNADGTLNGSFLSIPFSPSNSFSVVADASGALKSVWVDSNPVPALYYGEFSAANVLTQKVQLTYYPTNNVDETHTSLGLDSQGEKHVTWVHGTSRTYSKTSISAPELACREGTIPSFLGQSENVLLLNSGNRAISFTSINASTPDIIVGNDISHLVWSENGIHYRSYNDTTSISGDVLISQGDPNASDPAIAFVAGSDSRSAGIVWGQPVSNQLQVFFSHVANGSRDVAPVPVSATGPAIKPRVATGGTDFGVVWQGVSASNNPAIWFKAMSAGGNALSLLTPISTPATGSAFSPDIAHDASRGYFFIVWQQDLGGGNSQIYGAVLATTTPGSMATIVVPPTALFSTPVRQLNPRVVSYRDPVIGSAFLFAWAEDTGSNPGIKVARAYITVTAGTPAITVSGVPFSIPQTTALSDYPRLASDSNAIAAGHIHIFWSERRSVGSSLFEDRYGDYLSGAGLIFGPVRIGLNDILAVGGANAISLKNGKPQFIWQGGGSVRFLPNAFMAGDPITRELTVPVGTPLELAMGVPSREQNPPKNFALYAWRNVPTSLTVTTLPRGLGKMCMSPPFTGGTPLKIWNNIGDPRLGTPTYTSSPAPSVIADIASLPNRPGDYTLQGIIQDSNASNPDHISITNAIILHVVAP